MKFFKIQYILLDLVIIFTALYFIPYDLKVYIHNYKIKLDFLFTVEGAEISIAITY